MGPVAGLFSSAPDFIGQTDQNKLQWTLCYALANNAAIGAVENDSFLFDGQTQRLSASLSWPINDNWTISLDTGGLRHSGGFLDPTIESWHKIFGLPNGIRDTLPSNDLNYQLRQDGLTVIDFTQSRSALTDSRFHIRRRIHQTSEHWLGTQLTVKLPTGKFDDLAGSGATDVSLGLHWHWQGNRFGLRSAIGYSYLGDTEFGARQRRHIGYAKSNLSARLTKRYALDAGVDLRQAVLRSDLRAFSNPALALHAGLSVSSERGWRIRFGFSEDIRVESEPDVVFRLTVSRYE